MKLLTFERDGRESWGFLYQQADPPRAWVFNPAQLVQRIGAAVSPTAATWLTRPRFRNDWPDDLAGMLKLQEPGMADLRQLHDYLHMALRGGGDTGMLMLAGLPLEQIKIKAPIPRPRLYFGLVQNGPTFIRNNPLRANANLFPQGHNRTQGTVLGLNDIIVHQPGTNIFGYNVELGLVIGKRGRFIPANRAMEHIAGFVPIIDAAGDGFYNLINGDKRGWETPAGSDWFQEATLSWCGKMADTMAPMGPYLVTRDEIPNLYDLLVYTDHNHNVRDRSHTGCHLLGAERLVHWFSSFATLEPGDVLHLGTMGVDGLRGDRTMPFGPDDSVGIEIERLGKLRNRVVLTDVNDWRDAEDPSRKIHPSPAVRDLIAAGEDRLSAEQWTLEKTRHYWTVYSNYDKVKECEGLAVSNYPRMLNTPVSSLATDGAEIDLPPRATTLDIGVELACVIGKLAQHVDERGAAAAIAGYTALISLSDRSFVEAVVDPATPQESCVPVVYGRWADAFNVISPDLTMLDIEQLAGRAMRIDVDGISDATGNSSEYVLGFPAVLKFITRYVTLFPGDVITLGRIAKRVVVPAHVAANKGIAITASIEGLPPVRAHVLRDDQRKETRLVKKSVVHINVDD